MNHCIPNRQLKGGTVYDGVIVTTPISGDTVHLVYRDKDSPLYRMPASMFQCLKAGLTNTERIRREQVLEFGDRILFTCREGCDGNFVVDYEKNESSVGKVEFIDGKYLLKTLCVLPPLGAANTSRLKGAFVWTKLFGVIPVSRRDERYMERRAYPNVAIQCWLDVAVDPRKYQMTAKFYDFHVEGIAREDMYVVWDADWNRDYKFSRTTMTILNYDSAGEDDDGYEQICYRDEYAIELGVKTRLEGIVISTHEIFCPSLRHKRVYMGLWNEENVDERKLAGCKIRFDAFYSDVVDAYIAYYYECAEACEPLCEVHTVNDAVSRILTTCQLYDYTMGGFLMHEYFGPVADRKNCLRALPFVAQEAAQRVPPSFIQRRLHGALDRHISVYIVDRGPSFSGLARFEVDCLPDATERLVVEADEELRQRGEMQFDGFVLDAELGQVYIYKCPTLQFFISRASECLLSPGVWLRVTASYNPYTKICAVSKHSFISNKPTIGCRLENDAVIGHRTNRRVYEISVTHHKLVKGALYNRLYGFIADTNKEFKADIKLRAYNVVVVQDMEDSATTLFRFQRQATRSDNFPTNQAVVGKIISVSSDSEGEAPHMSAARVGYDSRGDVNDSLSDNDSFGGEPDLSLIGLDNIALDYDEDKDAVTGVSSAGRSGAYNDNRQLSGVQFNSNHLRRERKVQARQRKIERDNLAREQEWLARQQR